MLTVVTAFDDPAETGRPVDSANLEFFAAESVEGRCVIRTVDRAVLVLAEPEVATEWRAQLAKTGVLDEGMYLDLLRHRLRYPGPTYSE